MTRQLTAATTLANLKTEARRWLKALRARNGRALARFESAHPKPPADPGLRDVHLAIAREFGLSGWTAVRNRIAELHAAAPDSAGISHAEWANRFLRYACPDWRVGGPHANARSLNAAARILERHPEIAHENIYTAAVCGAVEDVERRLAERPALIGEKGGPKRWPPLLYVCYGRSGIDRAVDVARLLLDRGADANAFFWAGSPDRNMPGTRYTALCGVVGEGEEDAQPHPHRAELAELLLQHGAEPYDIQLFYNTHFHGDLLWFLEKIYRHSLRRGREADWRDPEWRMIDMGGYGYGARYFLNIAVNQNQLDLAEWLLAHGAGANAQPKPGAKGPRHSLHEVALRRGFDDMAALLVRHGATPSGYVRSGVEAFGDACLRLDRERASALAQQHPEYLESAAAIMYAAEHDMVDAIALLLDLGVPVDIADPRRGSAQPLHAAAWSGSIRAAEFLIAHGAPIDPLETNWNGTPISMAIYAQKRGTIEVLARHTRRIFSLTVTGHVERIRELLAEEPELAKITQEGPYTPLMWLPDDEDRALEIIDLLIAHGADAAVVGPEGKTAADFAETRGLERAARHLREVSGGRRTQAPRRPLEEYEAAAADIVSAHNHNDARAIERLRVHFSLPAEMDLERMQKGIRQRLGRVAEDASGISMDEARQLVARFHEFDNWQALAEYVAGRAPESGALTIRSVHLFNLAGKHDQPAGSARTWDAAIGLLEEQRIGGLNAEGQMTDAVIRRIAELDRLTALNLAGSRGLTDEGILYLGRLPNLRHLNLSGTGITDRGLDVLRHLRELRTIRLNWQSTISDAGAENLRHCERLETVDLLGSATGDGAVAALAGKQELRRLKVGRGVTDAGLALCREIPCFREWRGGELEYGLMAFEGGPTFLCLAFAEGYTDRGVASLAGLDGLFALTLGDSPGLTAAGLEPLAGLANLGMLGCTNESCNDGAMRVIGRLPRLRMLMGQDAVAGDDGFAALARSATLEYIWGRRCYNLGSRGFSALAGMPALRGLSVSCRNVGDDGLATLPRFPALRELLPMDVADEGYRFIGQCRDLESLILMYCHETGDRATTHIRGLSKLRSYSCSAAKITDISLEILGSMDSLEIIRIGGCPGVTDAGIAHLARLPKLRELELNDLSRATRASAKLFPPRVHVEFGI